MMSRIGGLSRETPQYHLSTLKDAIDGACGSVGIICRDVLEDIFEPSLSFRGPCYFCHERMRRAISSFEITRFASESASPRSTMI